MSNTSPSDLLGSFVKNLEDRFPVEWTGLSYNRGSWNQMIKCGVHMGAMQLMQKRIYELPEADDGLRVLVDRLWPRGVRKLDAKVDEWLKDIAPTQDLRKWFGHEPSRFSTFRSEYLKQLTEDEIHRTAVRQLVGWMQFGPLTMLYAAKDPMCNHVVVLREHILECQV